MTKDPRRALFAACKSLGMDDDARRDMLQSVIGKPSSKDLTPREWSKVLDHMNKLTGFALKQTRKIDTSAEASKVRAIWLLLHQIGEVRDPSENALASYCKRIAKVDDLHWAGAEIVTLIETLKKWAQRKLPAALAARLARLQLAGLVDHRNTVRGLCILVAPRRDPDTFDPMWWAWDYLNDLERQHGQEQARN